MTPLFALAAVRAQNLGPAPASTTAGFFAWRTPKDTPVPEVARPQIKA